MKIFITGKNGFIAKHLIEKLEKYNELETSTKDENTIKKIYNFNPEIIYHLGAELYDDNKMFENNVVLTYNILEYCRQHNETKLIMFGSSSEYGRKNKPTNENDSLEPQTIYEGTKAASSMLCESWASTYNIKITLIRPFTIYGKNEKSNKLTQILMRKFKNNEKLQLAPGVHDYMHIDDFIDAVISVSFHVETKNFNKINIGSGIQITNEEFVRVSQNVLKYKFIIELVDKMKQYDSECWVCNNALLEEKYGFTPQITLENGLKKTFI